MSRSRTAAVGVLVALVLVLTTPVRTRGDYVKPTRGGAQMGGTQAPMIMPEIFFDGVGINVVNADQRPWPAFPWSQAPVLRPLSPPNQFDPTQPWAVLTGKAYNFQYGWDAAMWDETSHPTPPGSAVWIKRLRQSPELTVYFKDGAYAPLFGTPDANGTPGPDIWMWDKRMRHNTYAVPESFYGRLSADYKIYLGNATSGAEFVDANGVPLFKSALVTLNWIRPCPYPLPGDINSDCVVDSNDLLLLADKWLTPSCSAPDWCDECDINRDGSLDMVDMTLLMDNWHVDARPSALDPAPMQKPGS